MEQNESYIFGVSSFGCLLIQFVTLAGGGGTRHCFVPYLLIIFFITEC